MKARVFVAALMATVLVACSDSGHVVADLSGPRWAVDGVMVDEAGRPQEGLRMEIMRSERADSRPFPFAVIATGRDGHFYFETPVEGWYSMYLLARERCMEPLDLGDMRSGTKTLRIVVKSTPCPMIL